MGNENTDSLKITLINKVSELSDELAKGAGYKYGGAAKALATDLCDARVISKETKDALFEAVEKRTDLAHPRGEQKTDVNTYISTSDVIKVSDAVDEVANKLAGDIDMNF